MQEGRIPRRDPRLAAMVLWAGVHGAASLLVSLPDFPWPERGRMVRAVLDSQEAALRVPASRDSAW
jgi:hypothetical protein